MKNLLALLLIITLFSCEKEEPAIKTGTITFYMPYNEDSWNLIVDGVDKGPLIPTVFIPECGDYTFITLKLRTGKHTYDVKHNDGLAWGDAKDLWVHEGCEVVRAIY